MQYNKYPWYRHVCAIGAVINTLMMVAANLVGFVVGTDGTKFFFGQLFGTWEGIRFMVVCLGIIFVGIQLMFEYRCVLLIYAFTLFEFSEETVLTISSSRAEELRQGIVRRY